MSFTKKIDDASGRSIVSFDPIEGAEWDSIDVSDLETMLKESKTEKESIERANSSMAKQEAVDKQYDIVSIYIAERKVHLHFVPVHWFALL
jgi:hypothetical protein